MTMITDGGGTRWVEITPKKRRSSPRAVRFAEIKVGDQLEHTWEYGAAQGRVTWHYRVSDLWFDPVAGQDDETAGRMVAIQRIAPRTGEIEPRKRSHTIRGLASQGFTYAKIDFLEHAKLRNAAMADGAVVGIGRGHVIRKRPKLPEGTF